MEINFKENPKKWDAFVTSSPQRSIFVYTKFFESLGVKYDLVTCSENNRIIAGVPIIFEGKKPLQSIFPFTQFQGIVLADHSNLTTHSQISLEFKATEFIIDQLVKHYKMFCLCNSWRLTDMRPFQWHNYHEKTKGIFNLDLRYTAVLDLKEYSNFDSFLNSIRKVRRQEIKKANNNLVIEEIKDEKVLDELHDKTFQRQKIKRDSKESRLVKNITKSALTNGYGHLTCAKIDGIPVAANLLVFDDRTGYYLFGANHPDYRNSYGGTLLLADAIQYCINQKLSEVDFVGVNSPNRGDFKLSFNAKLKPYFITSFPDKSNK